MLSTEKDKTYKQVVSRQRVTDHGEVYTSYREVNAMLDLVKQETERIESRFLEPACGTGNFLIEILRKKLKVVEVRYRKNQIEFERYAVIAISSIYGIDILEDNTEVCRRRLQDLFITVYRNIYKDQIKQECLNTVTYILKRNIIWGDALTLVTVGIKRKPIVFSEWSMVTNNKIKRRDFTFHELLKHAENTLSAISSDSGDNVFIPEPIREYPLNHFLRISDV